MPCESAREERCSASVQASDEDDPVCVHARSLAVALRAVSSEPLRILGVGNGRSVHLLRWARGLAERGHEVHLVSHHLPERTSDLSGVQLHSFAESNLLARVRGVRRFLFGRAIARLAQRLRTDVVHAHYLLPYAYWAARADVHPLVVSPWGTDLLVHGRSGARGEAKARLALAAADQVVVNSQALARAAAEHGVDPQRIVFALWHADLEPFLPGQADLGLRERLGWPSDALVVLSLRAFRPDTNLDVLVRAFARVAEEEPRARLLLAARTGPLRREMEELVAALGLDPVVAFEAVPPEELPQVVAAADLAVSLANSDSAPPSLLEAMASRLPVVCSEAASIDEWVAQDEGAEMVPRRDDEATAAAILLLCRDDERRRRYGERNRAVILERAAPAGPALEALYRKLAA
jgi:glycosyltransferase involved in cell wall biosynthesis